MIADDAQGVAPATAGSTDERRLARLAQIEAEQAHVSPITLIDGLASTAIDGGTG